MGKVFGVLLESVPTMQNVPFPVYELITYLTEKPARVEAEGIFRISGKLEDINLIKKMFNKGEHVELTHYDIHTVAAVLKAFFRELPDSLVKKENTDMIIATVQMDDKFYPTKIKNIQNILSFLPPVYYSTLKMLLHYLRLVCDASAINKMNVSNISIIFGVNIFTGVNVVDMISSNNSDCFACTRFLIENYKEVFDTPHDNTFKTSLSLPSADQEPSKPFLLARSNPTTAVPRRNPPPPPRPQFAPVHHKTNSAETKIPPTHSSPTFSSPNLQITPQKKSSPKSLSPTAQQTPEKPKPDLPPRKQQKVFPKKQKIADKPLSFKSETDAGRAPPPPPKKRNDYQQPSIL
ncbi:hypothetical protein EIN_346660 [Entamoeba invadens IP1]|uniref:Rho-GAP domain-containing protein n=1 Tax=Entamoeba invadens IP1 TaxID=370355 RepID=L7FLI2_ENTIV|nr:hypothetical protein EIN_346660 [Entamoeba invadens IP1]ELP84019.1 hypothetical protein EIN_346660 [Entamoeba invadens IP1]|eukprot:XP_004183365.1 hypothetical protein EIN_346660 [Entamoeba invadens IP1]